MLERLAPPLDILAESAFFAGLSHEQLDAIRVHCQVQEFVQGSHIYVLGEPATNLYALVEGMVRFALGVGSREASVGEIIRRGQVFGWAALLEKPQTRIANAFCLTSCVVVAMNGNEILRLMDQDHTLGYVIMKRLNKLITGELAAFAAG
ncbi:MAG: Crp/Fnr family transcriptional regulator [Burkholderiales bacterium]